MFHARPAWKVRAYLPCLEVLEDRNLLSTYLVDRLTDANPAGGGQGSELAGDLRYCITNAATGDEVGFGVTGTITPSVDLPALARPITIHGPGVNLLSVDGASYHNVVTVPAGSQATIFGLTVANVPILNLGGLELSDCVVTDGVLNGGFMSIANCTLGSIDNGGDATVLDSTLTGSTLGGYYSSIYNTGSLTLRNSTVSGNMGYYTAIIVNEIPGEGESAQLTISSCTISGNTLYGFGPGSALYNEESFYGHGIVDLSNTIIGGNSFLSGGEDIHQPASYVHFHGRNLIGGNPRLGDLRDNGGPTFTMAPLPGSPALNQGSLYDDTDQRGVVRTGGTNIGAYQASASAFVLTTPDTVTAGTPFDVIVRAVDPFGQTAVSYTGTGQFGSTDGQAGLPSDYTFSSGDAGLHTFTGGVTLKTAGNQTVTTTDSATASITGSASVNVNPAAADHLLFLQQPIDTPAGQTISPVVVEVVDQFGNVEASDNSDTITLSIGTNPSGGTLSGTLSLTVVNGVATFTDLTIDMAGGGYTLHASAGGAVPDSDSYPFTIT